MSAFPFADLQSLIQNLTSFNVVYAEQNAPRPEKPYATIRRGGGDSSQNSEWGDQDELDNRLSYNNVATMFELNFFGLHSIDEAQNVCDKLTLETVIDTFFAKNLSVINKGQVRNLTVLLNQSQNEQRGMFEFLCGWRSYVNENVGHIERVEVTGNTADIDPTVPDEPTVEITVAVS